MIDIVSPLNTGHAKILSDRDLEKHTRNLKTIYYDKARLRNAHIWINGVKVKFGKDLNHTIRNINKSYAQAGVKASIKHGKLELVTRSNVLKIHDPNKILKTLVDKDRVGINKYHDIQIIRKSVGDAKFIYTFNDMRKDYGLDKDFSRSSTIYCSGASNIQIQDPEVVYLENLYAAQNVEHLEVPEPQVGILVRNIDPLVSHDEVKSAVIQQNLSLENSEQSAVLVPAVEFEIAKIIESFSVEQEEVENDIDYHAMAIELLNNKTQNETRIILTEVIKDGNVNLIEAMMQVIDNPPEDIVINKPGLVGMRRVYNDSLVYSRELSKWELSDNIKKACGAIAVLAKMDAGHQARIFHNLEGSHYSSPLLSG